jgi:HAD superfamily hydrolase (TIGR01459 family)
MVNIRISPIREVVKSYDVLLVDVWGVLYDGMAPYNGAVSFLNEMLDNGKKIIFLSNNPRPGYITNKQFVEFGLNMNKAEIYTSGDAVREQLTSWSDTVFSKLGKRFYHLGAEGNTDILSGIAADVTDDITKADFLLITEFVPASTDLNIHDELLAKAASLHIPAICANPDLTAYYGKQIRYCAGKFAQKYEKLGGVVHYYGKPDNKIYDAALSKYSLDCDKKKILMIGDTLETDILGAQKFGIDSALVLTGNGEKIGDQLFLGAQDVFKDSEVIPTWVTYGIKG